LARLEGAAKAPDLTELQRHEVAELSAHCLMAEGQRDAALEVFTRLLRAEPHYEVNPEATAPKVREVFDLAKQGLYPRDFLQLERLRAPAGRVVFKVIDPWHRAQVVRLHQRRAGGSWGDLPLAPNGGLASFELVAPPGGTIEWYVDVRGADGQVLAHLGTADEPHLVSALRAEVIAVAEKPASTLRPTIGWSMLGIAAVAGAVATGLQVSGWSLRSAARDASKPPGDWVDTAQRAEADGVRHTNWATALFIGAGVGAGVGVGLVAW
jgi:hypothetical protein